MTESFELTVTHKGKTHILQAALRSWGYSHIIAVQVGEQEVVFEPDEERNYRAVVAAGESFADAALLAAIAETLEAELK